MENSEKSNIDINLQNELLEIAKEIISRTYGEAGKRIFDYLLNNEVIIEEKLTTTLNVRSNEARKILQYLSEEALVIPEKVKDDETNKALHAWRLNRSAVKTFILNRLKKTKQNLELLLKLELENAIYVCQTCGRRYLDEEAIAYEFTCIQDGGILVEANDPKVISKIQESIKKIDMLISMIERI